MKKALIALAATLPLLLLGAVPASASGLGVLDENAFPSDMNGDRFWSPSICVQSPLNATTYPVAYAAQQYNIKVGAPLAINFRADCEASGYTPSRSFTVSTWTQDSVGCLSALNSQVAVYNGMKRWTNHPVILIKTGTTCVATQERRDHMVSMAIGWALGLQNVQWPNSLNRVMNNETWSFDNVPWVTAGEATRVREIYTGVYGGQ